MPEEEGWAVQGATGCFLKMEGISKSRLSPETIRRLPPLFYTKRDPARYSSGRAAQEPPWWDGPGQESIRGTHQACGCVPLRGFQRNVHKRLNGFLLLLNIPKSAAPCWKVYLVDSINETLFFFFWISTEPLTYGGWILIVRTVVQRTWRGFLGVSQRAEDKRHHVP